MAVKVQLYIDHVEVSEDAEWDMTFEEVLGGVGRATVTVQDRDLTLSPRAHQDVKGVVAAGPLAGWVLFRGEIISEPLELPVGFPWRRWKLDCADYGTEFDWRLVGALDGKTWLDQSGLGIFVNIDPFAPTLETDRLTIQNWFDHYIRVDGEAIGTDTFVGEFLTDFTTLTPAYTYLRPALEQMAAFVAGNLQLWLDPDLEFHWALIPSWRDVLQEIAAVTAGGEGESSSALMFGEPAGIADFGLSLAPYDVSDVRGGSDVVGASSLRLVLDGKEMPEQVYVRGATGYVYNAPPIPPDEETKVVDDAPIPGADGTYRVTITANDTKLWHTDSTGYVSTSFDLVATGGPWPVKFVHVPWSVSRHKGGYYWKFLAGPHVGKLADDHTNNLTGYGEILVELVPPPPAVVPPQIGTGGSGWVGEATQDPNKRQAYLEAPISTTQALRDALGGQAVYRGSYETLRGSLVVRGRWDSGLEERVAADGWRVGQVVKITDARMPDDLNGLYYVIQRVQTKAIPTSDVREYAIDFGDGPVSRYSYQSGKSDAAFPPPMNQLFIDAFDLTPGPSSSQTITAQLVNGSGEPWAIPGKVVEWTFECYNSSGALQTGQGTILPAISATDDHGKARTTLTTGPGVNLVYYVFASVKAT